MVWESIIAPKDKSVKVSAIFLVQISIFLQAKKSAPFARSGSGRLFRYQPTVTFLPASMVISLPSIAI